MCEGAAVVATPHAVSAIAAGAASISFFTVRDCTVTGKLLEADSGNSVTVTRFGRAVHELRDYEHHRQQAPAHTDRRYPQVGHDGPSGEGSAGLALRARGRIQP